MPITALCLTHRPPWPGRPHTPADPGYRTCTPCSTRIHGWLSPLTVTEEGWPDNIPGLYQLLDPRPGVVGAGRRVPGYASRSPANDHVIAMRDPRSVRDPRQPLSVTPHSVPGTLTSWCQELADARGTAAPREWAVPVLAAYLDAHLDWLTRQDWIPDLATELRELHTQLYQGRRSWRRIGRCRCPGLTDTGTCGAALFASLDAGVVRCWACGAQWERDRWLHLGNVLAAL